MLLSFVGVGGGQEAPCGAELSSLWGWGLPKFTSTFLKKLGHVPRKATRFTLGPSSNGAIFLSDLSEIATRDLVLGLGFSKLLVREARGHPPKSL